MQSDDVFRRLFEIESARLAAMAEALRDVAVVTCEPRADYFRLALEPHAANACPVELLLHRPSQSFDIQIGSDVWESELIGDLGTFAPLLDAIVAGRVVTRHHETTSSGAALSTTVLIDQGGPADLALERVTALGTARGRDDAIARDRHWLAYRR